MPSLLDAPSDPAKILLLGDQGSGKTGSKASAIACGYKWRMIDTDKGARILRGLLSDVEHYPYASYMKKKNIIPDLSYIPIEVPMDFKDIKVGNISWEILGPASSIAWKNVIKLLQKWEDDGKDYGAITDWDEDTVLDFDTMSTLAEIAKYWVQDLNGHLGSLIDEHGRDTGGAQEMIMRLMTKLTNPSVKCNAVVTAHIKRVDMSMDGIPQSPEQRLREKKSVKAQGFPAVIGQAVSPFIGKKFNDQFIVEREGEGRNASRRIYTVPTGNTSAKNSVWLEESYPLETGMVCILEALRYRPIPQDFLDHCEAFYAAQKSIMKTNPKTSNPTLGGFGRS